MTVRATMTLRKAPLIVGFEIAREAGRRLRRGDQEACFAAFRFAR